MLITERGMLRPTSRHVPVSLRAFCVACAACSDFDMLGNDLLSARVCGSCTGEKCCALEESWLVAMWVGVPRRRCGPGAHHGRQPPVDRHRAGRHVELRCARADHGHALQ